MANFGDVPQLLKDKQQQQQQQQQQIQKIHQQQQQQQLQHQHQLQQQQQQQHLQQLSNRLQRPQQQQQQHQQQQQQQHQQHQQQQQQQQQQLQQQRQILQPQIMTQQNPYQLQHQHLMSNPRQQSPMQQIHRGQHPLTKTMHEIQRPQAQGQVSQMNEQNTGKEINTARFCTIGMQLVQEIVQKTLDMFNTIKSIHVPNGLLSSPTLADKRQKFNEHRENLVLDFRKLRVIFSKVSINTHCYKDVDCKSLIPFVIEDNDECLDAKINQPKIDSAEVKFYKEQLQIKNHQLKSTIDEMRTIVFEINAMLDMKR